MKVLDVNEFYAERGGGVRTYVNRKLAHGHRLGHEVVVVAPGPSDGVEHREGGRIIWVAGPPLPFDPRYHLFVDPYRVQRIIDAEAPHLIEGSSVFAGGLIAARARARAAKVMVFHQDPVAVYAHGLFDRFLSRERLDRLAAPYWRYLRALSARFDHTVVSGRWLVERLEAFGVHRPVAVPFGIESRRFRPERRDEAVRREWLVRAGLSSSSKLLIAVSRHHPEKRLGTLVEAVDRINRRRPSAEVALVVFGDGPLRRWVERRAARARGVVVAGFTDDADLLPNVMASADAFVHGSSAETYGLVVAEALSSGLPLVVPDFGGARELAPLEVAERYAPGDASACARAIERLFARDVSSLRRRVVEERSHWVSDVGDHFESLFSFYEEAHRRKRRGSVDGAPAAQGSSRPQKGRDAASRTLSGAA